MNGRNRDCLMLIGAVCLMMILYLHIERHSTVRPDPPFIIPDMELKSENKVLPGEWTFNSSLPAPKALLSSPPGLCTGVLPEAPIWQFQSTCGCRNVHYIQGLTFKCGEKLEITQSTSVNDARRIYYKHMLRHHVECASHEHLGNVNDGGWLLCKEGPLKLNHSNCLIYSIGIRNDWSFDDAVFKKYNCDVRSWDPSIGKPDHKHAERIWFYATGLGGRNEEKSENSKGWRMRTLGKMFKELGHENVDKDFVKFDIEFSEWTSLEAMITEGSLLRVKQLALEVHTWRDNLQDYLYFTRLLQSLENLGFQRWHHLNLNWRCFKDELDRRYCPQCNMHFINMNYFKAHEA